MSAKTVQGQLASFVGLNIDDYGALLESIIDADGATVWRWLTPSDEVDQAEVRADRINVNVDERHVITSITIG
jgi:hypothetical protein